MAQIIGKSAKCKRANIGAITSGSLANTTPPLGQYVLISSDNSMQADGQGNFDLYIVGNGTQYAKNLPVYSIMDNKNEYPFTENGFIDSEGNPQSYSSWKHTDYIPIMPEALIEGAVMMAYDSSSTSATVSYVTFYDANKVLIDVNVPASSGFAKFAKTAPENAAYAIVSTQKKFVNASYVCINNDTPLIGKVTSLDFIANGIFDQGGYINTDGTITPLSATTSWAYTDYIKVIEGATYKAALQGQADTTLLMVFYDNDKNIISTIAPTQETIESVTGTVPSGCAFVRACTRTRKVTGYYITIKMDYNSLMEAIVNSFGTSDNTEHAQMYGSNLHKPFIFNGKTAAFFGDSVTNGVYSGPNGVTTDMNNCYRKYLCDLAGMTGTNYAVSGSFICDPQDSSSSILNKVLDNITAQSNFDFVFIAGGINDYWTGKPLGELGDTTYATFYGALHVMCEHLVSVLSGTQTEVIFLTPINYSKGALISPVAELYQYRNAIFEVATMHGFNVLDTSIIGFPTSKEDTAYKQAMIYDGVHPTIAGHLFMAQNIYSALL